MRLPLNLDKFLLWWVYKFPRRLLFVFERIVAIVNNTIAFTLNLKLLFTPIFGDYTIVGRAMGLVFRSLRIVTGFVILVLVIGSALIFLPLWYLAPFILLYKFGGISFLFVLFLLLGYEMLTFNRPDKKVSEVKDESEIRTCMNFDRKLVTFLGPSKEEFVSQLLFNLNMIRLLDSLEINNKEFLESLTSTLANLNLQASSMMKMTFDFAKEGRTRFVEVEHLFLAILAALPKRDFFLAKYGLTFDSAKECAFWLVEEREALAKTFFWQEDYSPPPIGGVNRGWTGRITPLLDLVSEDYTQMAQRGYFDKVVGKERAIGDVINALSRGTSNNVLVVGEPGSGKTTMIKGIAEEIVFGTKAESLKFKRLVALQSGALIAGCKTPGEVTEKLEGIIKEIKDTGNVILFIDEVHNLVASTGSENAQLSAVFSALEPHLSSGAFQFIGATSIPEYRRYIEPNGAFNRLFQVVTLEESSLAETLEVLKVLTKKYRRLYGVRISFLALKKIIELSSRLIRDRVLPDKAVDILERSCVSVSKSTGYVTSEVVREVISEVTKVPMTAVSDDESKKLLNIESEIKKRVIGQDEAIIQVGNALRRARAGVRDEKRPIASFLFVGSTGVGKTETAKAIAESYFGDEKIMIRLDMSEFQKDDSVDKLIGTSDGKTVGVLSDKVRRSPFSLILLDEVEKASAKVSLIFLQVLDDGRLTDSMGRVVDFTNSIIIATSNVGTSKIQEVLDKNGEYGEMKSAALLEVRDKFAPEFLNRFSGIVVFKPLYPAEVREITRLLLSRVAKNLDSKGIRADFKPDLVDRLAAEGFDPLWGARPLRRLVENTVESYLARKLLASEIAQGDFVELGVEVFEGYERL